MLDNTLNNDLLNFPKGLLKLTPREWDVLVLIAQSYPSKNIAESLCITPKSVCNYKNRICAKLQIDNSWDLFLFASQNKEYLTVFHEKFLNS